jgi:putative membrane protein
MNRSLNIAVVAVGLTGPMMAVSQTWAETKSNAGIEIPQQENEFAQRLHAANQSEVKLGQLAQQKAQSDSVKDVAKMIVDDHQKADAQLQQLAKKEGWKLKEPKPLNATERAVIDADHAQMKELQKLDGRAFEQAYLAHMVADHDMNITKAALAAKAYGGSELGNLIQQMLPKLQEHRERSYDALGEVKANPDELGVGGSGAPAQGANQKDRRSRGKSSSTKRSPGASTEPGSGNVEKGGGY